MPLKMPLQDRPIIITYSETPFFTVNFGHKQKVTAQKNNKYYGPCQQITLLTRKRPTKSVAVNQRFHYKDEVKPFATYTASLKRDPALTARLH